MVNPPAPFVHGAAYGVHACDDLAFYVDGESSFAAIAEAIEAAKVSVRVTVCFASLNFRLRPPAQEQLLDLCARTAARGVEVTLLFWQSSGPQGAPGSDGTVTLAELEVLQARAPGVHARWDASTRQYGGGVLPTGGCHPQKSFIIDGRVAFVGGINMTQEYWDTTAHLPDDERRLDYGVVDPQERTRRARLDTSLPLHDVYARFTGPAVADVDANFVERWNGATHATPGTTALQAARPGPEPAGSTRVQVLRTIFAGQYPGTPESELSILEAMLGLVDGAHGNIYFENQYFFHSAVTQALFAAVQRGVVVVGLLSRRPDAGTTTGWAADVLGERSSSALSTLQHQEGTNLGIYCPFTRGSAGLKDIYVHSKTMIVDDRYVLVGSANISSTSLEHHSELCVLVQDEQRATALRLQLWAEHLRLAPRDLPADFAAGAALWSAHARDNLTRAKARQQLRSHVLRFAEAAGGSNVEGESLEERLRDAQVQILTGEDVDEHDKEQF